MIRRLIAAVLVLGLIGAGVWWFALRHAATDTADANRHQDLPVVLAKAVTRDVPVYLDGLGTAQASATVTVRPQVDGTLVEVGFKEGQDVRKGDVLARIDPRTYQANLDQAVAKKAQDQANLANARVDLARYNKLAASAYTSAQTADAQKATVAELEAQVAQDQAQIDNARVQLGYTTITAPIDGRTGIRQVDQGNLVHATDTSGIVVLTTLRPIDVVFTLPQQQLAAVTAAMAAGPPEVVALPQAASQRTDPLDRGTLSVLDNQVDLNTGTIKLKASFPNERLQLWPGAFVTIRLRVRLDKGATVVPTVAIQRGPQGSFVWVVADEMKAERRPVTVGVEDLGHSVILQGLRPAEQVVVDGTARLTDGAKVVLAQQPGQTPPPTDGTTPPSHRRAPAVAGAT